MSTDSRVEDFCRRKHYAWEWIDTIAIADIDMDASMHNSSRLNKAINPDAVLQYGCAMLDGVQFTAIVVYRGMLGMWVLVNGVHRIRAAKDAGWTDWPFGAYVLTTENAYERDMATMLINTIETAIPITHEERILNALTIIERYGRPVTEVAAEFGLHPDTVGDRIRARRAQSRIIGMGGDPRDLTLSALRILHQIDNDHVLKAAADVIVAQRLGQAHVEQLLRDLGQSRTESDQLRVVAGWAANPKMHKQPRPDKAKAIVVDKFAKRRQRVANGLRAALRECKRYPSATQLQLLEPAHYAEVAGPWHELNPLLRAILEQARGPQS